MELSPADIKLILSTLQECDYEQAEVVVGDVRIAVAHQGGLLLGGSPSGENGVTAASAPAKRDGNTEAVGESVSVASQTPQQSPFAAAESHADASASAPAATDAEGVVVKSPSVGVFWRAPEPGANPFVEVGSRVEAGDTIGIVEVMKLMQNIPATVPGTVTAVHVENAANIEHGTPLVTIASAE